MKNLSPTFNWNHARAFLATAHEGSLTGAAKVLRESQPTLGRQIAKLEEDLGLTLFERLGRTLKLTESGQQLQDHFLAMAEAADEVTLRATQQSEAIEGQVTITATNFIATHVLPLVLEELRETAPNLRLHLDASNEVLDLKHRAADIAVRHARPQAGDLIGKLISQTEARLFASPGYLARHGTPQSLEDLAQASFIGFEDLDAFLPVLRELGFPLGPENFRYTTNSGNVIGELVNRGLGISLLSLEMARLFPNLVEVLPTTKPIPIPIWLVCHRELRTSRKYRLVFDAVERALRAYAKETGGLWV